MLKESASARPFASTATCRKAVITTRILQLVHELCVKRIHVTKRDLFYTDVKLFEARGPDRLPPACSEPLQFGTMMACQGPSLADDCCLLEQLRLWMQDQGNSDTVLDDIACMLGCTRSSLNGMRILSTFCTRA